MCVSNEFYMYLVRQRKIDKVKWQPQIKTSQEVQCNGLFQKNNKTSLSRENALMELVLSDTLAHGGSRGDTAGNHLLQLVDVVCAAPFLMLDNINAKLHLGLLDELAVRAHADLAVGRGEAVADERRGVQAGEGDELPAVAELGQALDISLLLVAGHGRLPVERGGQVVGKSENAKEVSGYAKDDAVSGFWEGETYFCSGRAAWTPSANSFAWAKSGSLLSIQTASQ